MAGHHRRFPIEALRPLGGELTATIASSSLADQPIALDHQIRLTLAPFAFAGVAQDPVVTLFALPLEVRSWRQLAGRAYGFAPGSMLVDGEPIATGPRGAIELSGQRLPVRVTRIEFGAPSRGEIAAELHLALALGAIGCADADVALSCTLALGGVRVLGDIALLAPPSADEAARLATALLDVADYEPVVHDGLVTYVPRDA
jgi:hypothetical protein